MFLVAASCEFAETLKLCSFRWGCILTSGLLIFLVLCQFSGPGFRLSGLGPPLPLPKGTLPHGREQRQLQPLHEGACLDVLSRIQGYSTMVGRIMLQTIAAVPGLALKRSLGPVPKATPFKSPQP